MNIWIWVLCIAGAYLVGSIPFGVLIARARGVDIRTQGSRNIGATNVGRVLGRRFGILCFVLDLLKGAVPVLIAGAACHVLGRNPKILDEPTGWMWLWLAVAAAAVLGHMYSVYLGFKGGKGVATSFGAMLAMWQLLTLPALGALVVWYAALRLFRYVSLASILAAASLPIWYMLRVIPNDGRNALETILHASPPLIVTSALAALVIWRHRGNIGRLRRGEEPRTGDRQS